MSLSGRIQQVRHGFQSAFWVANSSEMFERLSFYSQQAFLSLFLLEIVKLHEVPASNLMGWFGLLVYALPVVVGSLADRFGFRWGLVVAFLIDGTGYFLLGSFNSSWMHPLRAMLPDYWLLFAILTFSAFGPALVKPCVVGSVAIASNEEVRSVGYAIYYWVVNIGGFLGPILGAVAVNAFGMSMNFVLCAVVVYVLVFYVLIFYREPTRVAATRSTMTIRQALANTVLVLRNWRFVLFMLIFSGYYVTFYAFFVVMPDYIHKYVNPALSAGAIGSLIAIDAGMIIVFQIPVNHLTRRMAPFNAMIFGAVFAALSMVTVALYPSIWMARAGLVVFAIGEMTQAPRYYEYISRLAPEGQQGVFMGYAFLPIALGYFFAGLMGGHLLHYFGQVVKHPSEMWWVLAGVGALATVLMILYNRVFVVGAESKTA